MEKSGRLVLRRDQSASKKQFRDLNCVQRSALAQVVSNHPDGKAVLNRGIFADAADIGRIFPGTLVRRDVAAVLVLVDHLAAWGFAQDVARFLGTDWLLELDIDCFRMTDEDRNTHRRA